MQAFEHLLERELISFADKKGRNQALEFRPVKLLISSRELAQSLKLNTTCPVSYCLWFDQIASIIACHSCALLITRRPTRALARLEFV
jgi:hypothetical protein